MKNLRVLKQLALLGAIHDPIAISSRELGKQLNISQQTASKQLLTLIQGDYITRELGANRQRIKLTEKGMRILRREYGDYQRIFELRDKLTIQGTVTPGFGEGQYYLTQKKYKKEFQEKLWFQPYEGTLNLKVSGSELPKLDILQKSSGILIKGFENKGRTFGNVKCFFATMQNIECAVILPSRSPYIDVVEVISKYHLRRTLGLKDGDITEVVIQL